MKWFVSLRYFVLTLILGSVSCHAQVKEQIPPRTPAVAGSFYPSDPDKLKQMLSTFFLSAPKEKIESSVAAVIVPHAGYVFSGEMAASAFALIDREREYSRVFVIGTSHHMHLKGASVYESGDFSTPLGIVPVDTQLARQLIREKAVFENVPAAHTKEHSIEVQLPFLQYWLKKPYKIVPVLIGTQSETVIREIASALKPYFTDENLFVISSDFSHYPDYSGAKKVDEITGSAIQANSPDQFLKAIRKNERSNVPGLLTSCCGWSSVLTLLHLTSESDGVTVHHSGYRNSGDAEYGDRSRVVGYHSFVFNRKKGDNDMNTFMLNDTEKGFLLRLARKTIENHLNGNPSGNIDESTLSESLKTPCGAFVTLHKKEQLRGCIGRFEATLPLYRVVQQMALSAAFQDYRFQPVRPDEMADIDLEISVLTPLKRIRSADEFVLGKHGIYIKKEGRNGTFLPQVAESTGWSKEEFLGHCARDKAGIGWDGWKDAELYIYEALIFGEKELMLPEK